MQRAGMQRRRQSAAPIRSNASCASCVRVAALGIAGLGPRAPLR